MAKKKKDVMDNFKHEEENDHEEVKTSVSNNLESSVVNYVLNKLGRPKNLVKVEAYNYKWGDKSNRWRINVVVEENVHTDLGTCIPAWRRNDCFFLHFDEKTKTATYCNPPIERKYE